MKCQVKTALIIPIFLACSLAASYGIRQLLPTGSSALNSPAHAGTPAAGGRRFALRSLQKVTLKIGPHTLQVWVMDTDAKREEGMMFLRNKQVKANEGMLFVFPYAAPLSFWMKNTLMPLDVAYLGADKRIINTAQMKALDETPFLSEAPAQYALEVKQGTLEKWAVTDGTRVVFPKVAAHDLPQPLFLAPPSPPVPTFAPASP
jgi:uncharacterized membrane protein (UPF0127 family)